MENIWSDVLDVDLARLFLLHVVVEYCCEDGAPGRKDQFVSVENGKVANGERHVAEFHRRKESGSVVRQRASRFLVIGNPF